MKSIEPAWKAKVGIRSDTVHETSTRALHGLLDSLDGPPVTGDMLPPLWHWLAFLPLVPQRELGDDGHPKLGEFLPPSTLPRRMYAGGRITFHADIAIGTPLVRQSSVEAISDKKGRSGDLRFVTVRHLISDGDIPAITEHQDIVYLEPANGKLPNRPTHDPEKWTWKWDVAVDPTLLFRFSALTYNAHRIHYDRAFAVEHEGYAGLVVHGPLQSIALLELIRRNLPGRRVRSVSLRAHEALFDDGPVLLRAREESENSIEMASFGHEGQLALRAKACLDE